MGLGLLPGLQGLGAIVFIGYLYHTINLTQLFLTSPKLEKLKSSTQCYPLDSITKQYQTSYNTLLLPPVLLTASVITDSWNLLTHSSNSLTPENYTLQPEPLLSYPLTFCYVNRLKFLSSTPVEQEAPQVTELFTRAQKLLDQNGVKLKEPFQHRNPKLFIDEAITSFDNLVEGLKLEEGKVISDIDRTIKVQDQLKRYAYGAQAALNSIYDNQKLKNAFEQASSAQEAFCPTLNNRTSSKESLSLSPRFLTTLDTFELKESEFFSTIHSTFSSQLKLVEESSIPFLSDEELLRVREFISNDRGKFHERLCQVVAFQLQLRLKLGSNLTKSDLLNSLEVSVTDYLEENLSAALTHSKSLEEFLDHLGATLFDNSDVAVSSPINYASPTYGASILTENTTSSASLGYDTLYRMMTAPKSRSQLFLETPGATDPVTVLHPELDLGQAWVMKGTYGQLTFQLSHPLHPLFFSLQAPPLSHDPNPTASPRDLELYALHPDHPPTLLARYHRPLPAPSISLIDLPLAPPPYPVTTLQLRILRNHGYAKYTKLYHVAVYGHPV